MTSSTASARPGASTARRGGFRGAGYAWFVYGSSRHGFADTIEEAKVGWKRIYEAKL